MGIRTPDLLNAIEALYQLSYDPLNEGKIKHDPEFLATSFAAGRSGKPGAFPPDGFGE